MEGFFLSRQPILDRNQNLVAFELLFRHEETGEIASDANNLSSTANVIVNVYGHWYSECVGPAAGFINADPNLVHAMISVY